MRLGKSRYSQRRARALWLIGAALGVAAVVAIAVLAFGGEGGAPPAQTAASMPALTPTPAASPTPAPTFTSTPTPGAVQTAAMRTRYNASVEAVQNVGESYIDMSRGYHLLCREEVVYTNPTGDELWEVYLRFYPCAVEANCVTVTAAAVNGRQAYYELNADGTLLMLPLTEPLAPGGVASIYLEYRVDMPRDDGRFGASDYGLMLGGLLATVAHCGESGWDTRAYVDYGDPFWWEFADYTVSLEANAGFLAAATAPEQSVSVEGNRATWLYSASNVRDFCIALCRDFRVHEFEVSGQRVALYANGASEELNMVREVCEQALGYFIERFGELPFERVCIVRNAMDGAMEYPGLIMLSSRYWFEANRSQTEVLLSHELAHQFWSCAVGNSQYDDAYIDEGLATFCSYMFIKEIHSEEYMVRAWEIELAGVSPDECDYTRSLPEYADAQDYYDSVYRAAALRLMELRESEGEERLFGRLRALYAAFLGKTVSAEDFERLLTG